MAIFANAADRDAIQNEMPWEKREVARTIYGLLSETAERHPDRPAISFQLLSGPSDKAETLSWRELRERSTRAANLFRSLGVEEDDVVACLLPNCVEAVLAFLGGATAGIVSPINPLLEPEQVAGILRETKAKVLVTLRSFPKTDVAQKAARAVEMAPNVETIVEIDLLRYLAPPKSWLVPLLRPKPPANRKARIVDFHRETARQSSSLDFEDRQEDRVMSYFHTGGTTGTPKVAQHRHSGFVYNGWLCARLLFAERDTLICPLPLFHVFAAVVIGSAILASGAHAVFPTPQGYRGAGVFDNFWKLVERWGVTFVIAVPTAVSALMQRPVDADISTLKTAFSGSAPLPVELYNRFRKSSGVTVVEGYGLTEATCLVSCNPPEGEKKVGSVGLPFPHTDVRILQCASDGTIERECDIDEIGEVCVANPGVFAGDVYVDSVRNDGLFADGTHLRTGDLGRMDRDGYLWITGRAKDVIIRGGHNIDPADIEDALMGHDAVAFAGAIGQPDTEAGELPCAYVELVEGARATADELLKFVKSKSIERAAMPKHVEILDELPKTAVGKVFKPELRKRAIARVLNGELRRAGHAAEVVEVAEDRKRGLVAYLARTGETDDAAVAGKLGEFAIPWEWR